uniref:Secreted protein n=1 Tax=Cacopsylla melanoneura TaxID=428564 RepID=A0A8D8ZYK1_9HEMI
MCIIVYVLFFLKLNTEICPRKSVQINIYHFYFPYPTNRESNIIGSNFTKSIYSHFWTNYIPIASGIQKMASAIGRLCVCACVAWARRWLCTVLTTISSG